MSPINTFQYTHLPPENNKEEINRIKRPKVEEFDSELSEDEDFEHQPKRVKAIAQPPLFTPPQLNEHPEDIGINQLSKRLKTSLNLDIPPEIQNIEIPEMPGRGVIRPLKRKDIDEGSSQISKRVTVDHLELGKKSLEDKNYLLAIQHLNKCLITFPHSCEALYFRALANFRKPNAKFGQVKADLDLLQSLFEKSTKPVPFKVSYLKGVTLLKLKKYKEALSELENAHHLNPTSKNATYKFAKCLIKVGRVDDALQLQTQFPNHNPLRIFIELSIAEMQFNEGSLRRSLKTLDSIHSQDPTIILRVNKMYADIYREMFDLSVLNQENSTVPHSTELLEKYTIVRNKVELAEKLIIQKKGLHPTNTIKNFR